ncbi:class I SAM-dependent methyltransferase [Micromonospora aurantiaca]|uniref:class I SAM-dependent methyltransferase n=1 Tax=Micromonospora aurantiaca (nom. illeg.) TaxID=47850 RepID=UPI000F3E6118|nr:class I SAM-dependent methyltransferase [Micromonospora aurantiaca]RNH98190.1 class I SAM-dependent methyltransferase [Micromonospora aurantiaca]
MRATDHFPIDPSNASQARAWDGAEGAYWATHAAQFERAPARYNTELLGAARIDDTSRVLDVGCGTGDITRAAARLAPAGMAHGVDLSGRMIDAARRRADEEGLRNTTFTQADAQVHPFGAGRYDIVVSRTGSMFFGDPAEAFANLARALRPQGQLTLLVWQDLSRNEWLAAVMNALAAGRPMPAPPVEQPGPFSMSDPRRTHELLSRSSFTAIDITDVRHPMWLGDTADDAHDLMSGLAAWMLDGLDPTQRNAALDNLRAVMRDHQTADDGVLFDSACWLISATRA